MTMMLTQSTLAKGRRGGMRYKRSWFCLMCMGEHWSDEERDLCIRKSFHALTIEEIRAAQEWVKSIDVLQGDGKEE